MFFTDIIKSPNYVVRLYHDTGCISFFNMKDDKVKDFNFEESKIFIHAFMITIPFGYEMQKILGDYDSFLEAGWKEFNKE